MVRHHSFYVQKLEHDSARAAATPSARTRKIPSLPGVWVWGATRRLVSDTGLWAVVYPDKDPQGNYLRDGRPLAAYTAPADCGAFGTPMTTEAIRRDGK